MRAANANPGDPLKKSAEESADRLISAKKVSQPLTAFADCLVDADTAASARFGRGRRKAFGASALVQFCAICALLIWPLFATGSRLIAKPTVIIPPYGGMSHVNRPSAQQQTVPPRGRDIRVITTGLQFHPPTNNHTRAANNVDEPQNFGDNQPNIYGANTGPIGPGFSGLIDIPGAKSNTPPPPTPSTAAPAPKAPVSISQGVVLASLIRRIEPIYPAIARQLHLEGVVELRAIIARDGTVQQLELVSGNPVLSRAARDAVLQWRFRPTLLNGEPVEVITYFTVAFHLAQ